MFRHNLLIAYRCFLRYKGSFFINVLGLSTGLTCTLLIYLWVADELAVDQFPGKDEQIYQVLKNLTRPDGIKTGETTPAVLGESLIEDIPNIDYAVSLSTRMEDSYGGQGIIHYNDKSITAIGLFPVKASLEFFRTH